MKLDFVFFAILPFLLSPKYDVFYSENLHNDRVQHCLHVGIFFRNFLRCLNSNFLKLKKENAKPGYLVPVLHLEFLSVLALLTVLGCNFGIVIR
jgi:hypothetical protein